MTGQLAAREPSVREFEATIERIERTEVVLSESYFYAESGGQPADRGTIDGTVVVDVQADADGIVHTLAEPIDATEGETVTAVIDDAFRTYCMRAHTASHALYGAGRRLLDDLGYGGFDIDEQKVRVDFTTTTDIDDAVLVDLERLTNRAVWESRPVSWEAVPTAEATAMDDIAFNTKTEEGAMAGSDTVRVVTIGAAADDDDPWDVAACGGTHVRNTAEIGPVSVLSRSNPGEGMTRIEFAVGPTGIDRLAEVHGAARSAAGAAGTNLGDLPETVSRLRSERESLREEVNQLTSELISRELAAFESIDRDGSTWAIGTLDGFETNDVGDAARDAVGDVADVIAAVGAGNAPYVVVASTGDVAAGDVIDDVTAEFGGGGGGSPTFAQGGGLSADPAAVVEYLRTGR